MKTLITLSALVAALSVSSVSLAGPAPGQPRFGERTAAAKASKNEPKPYALTGSAKSDRSAVSKSARGRTGGTYVSHRRPPASR